MKTRLLVVLAAVAMLGSYAPSAFAQNSFAGNFQGVTLIKTIACSATDTACLINSSPTILPATIKMSQGLSNGKALLLTGSLEDSLYTDTSSNGGGKTSSTATGSIVVTPVVTGPGCPNSGCTVYPSTVTFASRTQTLNANLGTCTVTSVTNPTEVLTCTDTDTIELILSTTSANSFNFIVPELSQGVYNVALKVGVTTSATSDSLSAGASAMAGVGVGSLSVQTVQVQTPFSSLNFNN